MDLTRGGSRYGLAGRIHGVARRIVVRGQCSHAVPLALGKAAPIQCNELLELGASEGPAAFPFLNLIFRCHRGDSMTSSKSFAVSFARCRSAFNSPVKRAIHVAIAMMRTQ